MSRLSRKCREIVKNVEKMSRMLRTCNQLVHMCIADADLPVVPKLKDQFAIIEEAHCGKGLLTKATEQEAAANIGSHFGQDKTAPFILNSFYFPNLYAKVAFVCRSCMVCQRTNSGMSKLTKVGSVLNPVQFQL